MGDKEGEETCAQNLHVSMEELDLLEMCVICRKPYEYQERQTTDNT